MTKPIVILRPVTGRLHMNAYEGWDRTNRRRVMVHRHSDDAAARHEFAALEKTSACDPVLVAGPAFHRLCFDSDIEFGDFLGENHTPEPEHPSIVLQTHPGSRRTMCSDRLARNDAEIAALMRPVFTAIADLHARTNLVHTGISPGTLTRMWSGRCTLTDMHHATEVGQRVNPETLGSGLFVCPETVRSGTSHRGMDMWSCGILIYRLAHRSFMAHPFDEVLEQPLWREASTNNVVQTAARIEYSPDMWRNRTAPKAAALCRALLDPHLEARPTAAEALRHDLFR